MDTKLRRAAIFDGLDTAAANALARRCKKVKFSSGCTVCREGEPGDELYVVISGHVKITRCSAGGDEAVTAILANPIPSVNSRCSTQDLAVRTRPRLPT